MFFYSISLISFSFPPVRNVRAAVHKTLRSFNVLSLYEVFNLLRYLSMHSQMNVNHK